MQDSIYQSNIYNWVQNPTSKRSAIISASAGSGKTTTLIRSLQYMIGDIFITAFNKDIVLAFKDKIKRFAIPNVEAATVHAISRRIITSNRRYINVNKFKIKEIVDELVHNDASEQIQIIRGFLQQIVALAKDNAFGVKGQPAIDDTMAWEKLANHHDLTIEQCDISFSQAIDLAIEILKISNNDRKNIDFGDMIYHVLLFDMDTPKYDWLLVDEAQDTNPARMLLFKKILKPNGRFVGVGDEKQAIYGFTGSDIDSMEKLKELFDCVYLPLSICYRCDKNIILEAQKIVPTIEHFEGNGEGIVETTTYEKFVTSIPTLNLTDKDGIICRNNAPLVPVAFSLIRKGIPCIIEGKDIGSQLANYTYKWKDNGLANFRDLFNNFIDKEIEKAQEKKRSQIVGNLEDRKDTMNALIDRCLELGQTTTESLKKLIIDMFSDSNGKVRKDILTLSSIHKSKGLEFDRVFCLGNGQFLPSKYATQEWMQIQETNLKYISITRAKHTLVFVEDVPSNTKKKEA